MEAPRKAAALLTFFLAQRKIVSPKSKSGMTEGKRKINSLIEPVTVNNPAIIQL